MNFCAHPRRILAARAECAEGPESDQGSTFGATESS
jgi:hypothetical protein